VDAPLRAGQVPALKLDSALRTAGEVDVLLSIIKATRNQLGKRARAPALLPYSPVQSCS
jgi:hypothetical protein